MNKILHAPPSSPSAGARPFALPSSTCRRRKEGTEEEEEDKIGNDEDGGWVRLDLRDERESHFSKRGGG